MWIKIVAVFQHHHQKAGVWDRLACFDARLRFTVQRPHCYSWAVLLVMRFPCKLKPCCSCPVLWNLRCTTLSSFPATKRQCNKCSPLQCLIIIQEPHKHRRTWTFSCAWTMSHFSHTTQAATAAAAARAISVIPYREATWGPAAVPAKGNGGEHK